MNTRIFAAMFSLSVAVAGLVSQAAVVQPSGRGNDRVILITLDGVRTQEMFEGFDPATLSFGLAEELASRALEANGRGGSR